MKFTIPFLIVAVVFPASSLNAQVLKWGDSLLKKNAGWYASDEAIAAANSVLAYQSGFGAWPKNTNLLEPATTLLLEEVDKSGKSNTIDNGATTKPMEFLARVYAATGEARFRSAFERGVNYLLESQYPNGGFPQFYPLRGDKYYSRITFNDEAMVNVLEVLADVARGEAPYNFVDNNMRAKAAASVDLGIDCILKSQIRQDGKLTAWCAQIDERTLEPAWARAYEPPSLSGGETVGIVKFLMKIEEPTPEIVAAVEGAVEWLRNVAIHGKRLEVVTGEDGRKERLLLDVSQAPLLWARFYELGTNRPLYLDRDSVFHYKFSDISYERRSGYSYHGNWGAALLEHAYPRWREKHNHESL